MAYDPTDVIGNKRRQEERQSDSKDNRVKQVEDVKLIMSTKEGRRFMWRLLDFSGVYRTSFTGNSETFFKEGSRNVGLMLLNEIHEHCPESFITMLKEAKRE